MDFGDSLGILPAPAPQRGKICSRPISTIMQNFTPIGGTVAEICGAVQKDMH